MKKPIIRWAGSKRKILPILLEKTPKVIETYYEPFCGSASLFFELSPKKAVLSDINIELVNTFQVIQNDISFYNRLYTLPRTKDEYLSQRSKNIAELSDIDRAIRFLYLNRFCFNGVYRTNKNGEFNVPFGNKTGDFPTYESFCFAQDKLKCAELKVADYKKTLEFVARDDFVYLDPPYSKSGRFTGEYGVGSFNESEIADLINTIRRIDDVGARFIFSYKSDPEVQNLLPEKYKTTVLDVNRHISGFKTTWGSAKEILVTNYE